MRKRIASPSIWIARGPLKKTAGGVGGIGGIGAIAGPQPIAPSPM